jgi:hypothetical protein
MNTPSQEFDRERRKLLDLLYTVIDDLEAYPGIRKRSSGFPFSILERSVGKAIDVIQGAVDQRIVPWVVKHLKRFRRSKR